MPQLVRVVASLFLYMHKNIHDASALLRMMHRGCEKCGLFEVRTYFSVPLQIPVVLVAKLASDVLSYIVATATG